MAWKNISEFPGFDPSVGRIAISLFSYTSNIADTLNLEGARSSLSLEDGVLHGTIYSVAEGSSFLIPLAPPYIGYEQFKFFPIENWLAFGVYAEDKQSGDLVHVATNSGADDEYPVDVLSAWEYEDPDRYQWYLYFDVGNPPMGAPEDYYWEFSVVVEFSGSASGGDDGCFWTDIVNATQVCGEP